MIVSWLSHADRRSPGEVPGGSARLRSPRGAGRDSLDHGRGKAGARFLRGALPGERPDRRDAQGLRRPAQPLHPQGPHGRRLHDPRGHRAAVFSAPARRGSPDRPGGLRRQGEPRRAGGGVRGPRRGGRGRGPAPARGRGTGLRWGARREPRAAREPVSDLRRAHGEPLRRRVERVPADSRGVPGSRGALFGARNRPLRGPADARLPGRSARRGIARPSGLRRRDDEHRRPRGGFGAQRHRRQRPGGDPLSHGRAGRGPALEDPPLRFRACGSRGRLPFRPDPLPCSEGAPRGGDRLVRLRLAAPARLGRADPGRAGIDPGRAHGRGEGGPVGDRGGGRVSIGRSRKDFWRRGTPTWNRESGDLRSGDRAIGPGSLDGSFTRSPDHPILCSPSVHSRRRIVGGKERTP